MAWPRVGQTVLPPRRRGGAHLRHHRNPERIERGDLQYLAREDERGPVPVAAVAVVDGMAQLFTENGEVDFSSLGRGVLAWA